MIVVEIVRLQEGIHVHRDESHVGDDEKIIEAEEQKYSNTDLNQVTV